MMNGITLWIGGIVWLFTSVLADFCTCRITDKTSCHCSGNFTSVPSVPFTNVHTLWLSHGKLSSLNSSSLSNLGNHLSELTITHMQEFTLVEPRALEGMSELRVLRITHTNLTVMPILEGFGRRNPLHTICLEWNKFPLVQASGVRTVELFLGFNLIRQLDDWTFNGSEISKLSLKGNRLLTKLSFYAFSGIVGLKELDLSDTSVMYLPPSGLRELESLKLTNTATLRTVPSIYDIRMLQKAWMTYAIHCCAFFPRCADEEGCQQSTETPSTGPKTEYRSFLGGHEKEDENETSSDQIAIIRPENIPERDFNTFKFSTQDWTLNNIKERKTVYCWPHPDTKSLCEDLITWSWLKGSIWIVVLIALIGNITVLLIVALSRSERAVARFLTANLAFADLCMALYLFLLATMDAVSSKAYYNYEYLWQRGIGCKVAGFLTVFSCQLSFFTLSLLTVERWFSIKRALHTNLLDSKLTIFIMILGWAYSVLMATLPLVGISNYSSSSVCLPMDIHDYPSLIYILFLICTGGVTFLLMCFCYTQIYLSLSQETRHRRGGRTIAMKILILVGTNFLCWTPIAIVALCAIAGHPLVSGSHSKIFLVFIYPINSCANPYLYVIMTKQFKKDLIMVLARYGLCSHLAQSYRLNHDVYRPMSHETYQTTLLSAKSFVV